MLIKNNPEWKNYVRETGVSRHHMGSIEGLLKHLRTSRHYDIEGLKEVMNWVLIMPRSVSLSDSWCKYFQHGT